MKKSLLISILIIGLIIVTLLLLPIIEIKKNNKLYLVRYSDDISEFETYTCYHESVSYNEDKNISITSFDIKKYFIFYLFTLEYQDGNLCDSEYVLEESYIENFINNAKIIYNDKNIDIKNLIEGKTAIVGNTKYLGNDYESSIHYKLDGRYEELYVFYQDDLLIIQVGSPDESTKFIAYK